MPGRRSLLLISNGHGEDVVGARLARALRAHAPDLDLTAFPTVGEGRAYRDGPAVLAGPLRTMPSGGTMMRTGGAVVRDLRAGFVGMTLAQLRDLRAMGADAVLVVGDVWAQALGLLPRARARLVVQTLVSARTERGSGGGVRAFRERFTRPERWLLRRAYARAYVRDRASEARLVGLGVRHARFLGNPMMDELDAEPLALRGKGPRLVLLPGTRGESAGALRAAADAVARLPAAVVVVPWVGGDRPVVPGWEPLPSRIGPAAWRSGGVEMHLVGGDRFAAALAWAHIAVGTAGTAHEQAAGRGVPVVTFPFGAVHPPAFVANQKRLLGDALEVVRADGAAIAAAVTRLADDARERERRGRVGRDLMGGAGGSDAIARDAVRVVGRLLGNEGRANNLCRAPNVE